MARITIDIPDELDEQFRETVFNKFGMKKGNLTMAIEEALNNWIEKEKGVKQK